MGRRGSPDARGHSPRRAAPLGRIKGSGTDTREHPTRGYSSRARHAERSQTPEGTSQTGMPLGRTEREVMTPEGMSHEGNTIGPDTREGRGQTPEGSSRKGNTIGLDTATTPEGRSHEGIAIGPGKKETTRRQRAGPTRGLPLGRSREGEMTQRQRACPTRGTPLGRSGEVSTPGNFPRKDYPWAGQYLTRLHDIPRENECGPAISDSQVQSTIGCALGLSSSSQQVHNIMTPRCYNKQLWARSIVCSIGDG